MHFDENPLYYLRKIDGKERNEIMIYLLLAIASSAMVSICMRFGEKHVKNEMGMFMANYAFCIVCSLLFSSLENPGTFISARLSGSGSGLVLTLGIISGMLYLASFAFLKFNMKHNGIVLASTFMRLGVLIPTLMAVAVFHETPNWTQVLGILLSLAAIIMIHFEKDALSEGNKKGWLLLLLVLSGITDSMANIYEQYGPAEGRNGYLLITFFTAFLISLATALHSRMKISGKDVLFGILLGIPNYFSARFLLLALGNVAAVLVYPTYSVATMITIVLAGVLVFHETLSRKKMYALGLIVLALCLLNL